MQQLFLLRVASLPPSPSASPTPRTRAAAVISTGSSCDTSSRRNLNNLYLLKDSNLKTLTTSANTTTTNNWDRTLHFLSDSLGIEDPLDVVQRNPALRSEPLSSLRACHSLLLSAGLSPPQISRLCSSHPLVLTQHQALVAPSIAFLRPLLPPRALPLALSRSPSLLLSPVASQLHPALLLLRRLSVPLTLSSSLLLACHVELTLLPKVHFLRALFPPRDLRIILRRFPRLLTFSIPHNLRPKLLFLQHHMRLDPRSEIRAFPQYFAYSLEHRIQRRHRILTQAGLTLPLHRMLMPSDCEFDDIILNLKLQGISPPNPPPLSSPS